MMTVEPSELAPREVDDTCPATAPTPTPTRPMPATDAPRIRDPATPVPAGSSDPPIDTTARRTPTPTHRARVTRKTAPIAKASATVIQPLVQTAPPMVLAAGESPVSALIPGVLDRAAKS